ncbi:L-proline trans-4-hydroxylase-like isoform X1 [Homarus americanus]|uniref:L-proline trans-4-hydroxylase-like isoform X1 n=2 Tax=Homarus americanus TaxID=6706 RepID=UPI001C457430|nr:L-proline trans-4-hydroxylase-like isoform X1 [Homarus americanus]XP_042208030.1 L-proline trans-4-hydroxylase-like isoform X1 [Homarus americanus]
MKDAFLNNGFILVRNMLTKEEVEKVRRVVTGSEGVMRYAFGRHDGISRKTMQCLWNHPGHDLSGALARIKRVAGTMEELMGGDEMYHYHSKVTMKDANTGGAFVWHQDYGYWYKNGNLFPDMGTVFIPIDDCTRERLSPGTTGVSQDGTPRSRHHRPATEADPERVEQARRYWNTCTWR